MNRSELSSSQGGRSRSGHFCGDEEIDANFGGLLSFPIWQKLHNAFQPSEELMDRRRDLWQGAAARGRRRHVKLFGLYSMPGLHGMLGLRIPLNTTTA